MREPSEVSAEASETFSAIIAAHAANHPDKIALDYNGRATSYVRLRQQVGQVANALIASGAGKGTRIAYLGRNSDSAVELALAAAIVGAVFSPIIWRLAPAEVGGILEDSGCTILFAERAFAEMLGPVACQAGRVILTDAPDYDEWRDAQPMSIPDCAVSPDNVHLQLYTSGTTGRPKGVMLSQANCLRLWGASAAQAVPWMTPDPDESYLIAMPYGHIAGIGLVLRGVMGGHTNHILPEFDAGAVLDAIEQHRIARLFLVPAALQILLAHPKAATTDFSSIIQFNYGASPIPVELLKAGMARLGCGFAQFYGMTETWGTVSALAPEDHDLNRPHLLASAGKAVPGVEIRIVGPDGATLAPGEIGEIAIRSPSNMVGYWNQPAETAKAMREDGWIFSGDAGLLDADGYLFIQDRIKDMIVSGGENIYPAEVESAIFGHPDIAEIAIIGVPDERWGEAVKAIVVARPGTDPSADDIIAYARTKIAAFKCPKSVDFIAALPRNPSGKILRRALRDPYWAGRERQVN